MEPKSKVIKKRWSEKSVWAFDLHLFVQKVCKAKRSAPCEEQNIFY